MDVRRGRSKGTIAAGCARSAEAAGEEGIDGIGGCGGARRGPFGLGRPASVEVPTSGARDAVSSRSRCSRWATRTLSTRLSRRVRSSSSSARPRSVGARVTSDPPPDEAIETDESERGYMGRRRGAGSSSVDDGSGSEAIRAASGGAGGGGRLAPWPGRGGRGGGPGDSGDVGAKAYEAVESGRRGKVGGGGGGGRRRDSSGREMVDGVPRRLDRADGRSVVDADWGAAILPRDTVDVGGETVGDPCARKRSGFGGGGGGGRLDWTISGAG